MPAQAGVRPSRCARRPAAAATPVLRKSDPELLARALEDSWLGLRCCFGSVTKVRGIDLLPAGALSLQVLGRRRRIKTLEPKDDVACSGVAREHSSGERCSQRPIESVMPDAVLKVDKARG